MATVKRLTGMWRLRTTQDVHGSVVAGSGQRCEADCGDASIVAPRNSGVSTLMETSALEMSEVRCCVTHWCTTQPLWRAAWRHLHHTKLCIKLLSSRSFNFSSSLRCKAPTHGNFNRGTEKASAQNHTPLLPLSFSWLIITQKINK